MEDLLLDIEHKVKRIDEVLMKVIAILEDGDTDKAIQILKRLTK